MQSIHTLSIDLETRSGADLKKTGVYRYTEDPDFGTNRPDPNVPHDKDPGGSSLLSCR